MSATLEIMTSTPGLSVSLRVEVLPSFFPETKADEVPGADQVLQALAQAAIPELIRTRHALIEGLEAAQARHLESLLVPYRSEPLPA